jgi:hypothetical protein
LKTKHRPDDPFDQAVILLNQIVQILDLTDLNLVAGFLVACLDSRGIGAALVNHDLVRQTMLLNSFLEKAQRGFLIAMVGQEEINGLILLIDGAL